MVLALAACGGNDEVGGSGETSESGDGSGEATGETSEGDGEGGSEDEGGVDPCDPNPCDDEDPCTSDVCDPEDGSCSYPEELNNTCRPNIDVSYPPRGATLDGPGDMPTVTVTGNVHSMLGDITGLTLNGESVTLEANGDFAHPVTAAVGGNTLVFETADDAGNERRRVQSFLWSPTYVKPTQPGTGMADQGLGIWLAQETLDDGDNSEPINDLASIVNLAVAGLDLSGLVDPSTPIANEAGYDIYLVGLTITDSSVRLTAIDGGIHLTATLEEILGDLDFDCTNAECFFLGGSGTGGLSVNSLAIDADLMLSVSSDHELVVDAQNVTTSVNPDDVDIWSNNLWTNFLLSIVEPLIKGGLVSDLENTLNGELDGLIGPLVGDGLSALAFDLSLELPSLAGGDPIMIDLLTDFRSTDFHDGETPPDPSPAHGGIFGERAGGFTPNKVAPWDNMGIPQRNRCGEMGQTVDTPRMGLLELGLSDDLLNQILFAGWRGGLLEFDVGPEILGDAASLETFGVTDLDLRASGMLAPTVSDCNESAELYVHVGDLRISGTLKLMDNPVTFTSHSSLRAKMALSVSMEGIGIGIEGVEVIETEITIEEAEMIEAETLIGGVLDSAIVDALEDALGSGGGLGAIPLPEIDLSAALGLPPGTAMVVITPSDLVRHDGVSVVVGSL